MDWLQVISAVGIGALLTKILDIVWLQRAVRESDKKKWIREQRLRVYSKLAEEILSLGRSKGTRENAFSAYALVAEAVLLVEDAELANDLENFFTFLTNLYSEGLKTDDDPTKKPDDELEEVYETLVLESRRLVKELRICLHR
jgi:hypothetical protein